MGDITSEQLSLIIDGNCSKKNIVIDNFSSLKLSNKSSVTFFSDRKLLDDLKKTKASVVILKQEDVVLRKGEWIVVDNPYLASKRMIGMSRDDLRKAIMLRWCSVCGTRPGGIAAIMEEDL